MCNKITDGKVRICTQKYLPQHNIPGVYGSMSAKGKTWDVGQTIDIYFMDGTEQQREHVVRASSEWLLYANLNFRFTDSIGNSDIRVSFANRGAYSYIGTDALFIRKTQETMNFGWLDDETILHEFGHFLARLHEHQHPDIGFDWHEANVLRILSGPPNNWDRDMIYHNVLNRQKNENVVKGDYDKKSIMHYFFPSSFTLSGVGMSQNKVLSEGDIAHARKVYPFPPALPSDKVLHALQQLYATKRISRLLVSDHKGVLKTLGIETKARRESDLIDQIRRELSNLNIKA